MIDKIRIKVDRRICSGCLSCMSTCSVANETYASLAAARIQVELHPFGDTHGIALCRQCDKAACVEACSEGAIARVPGGWLVVDYDRCSGCRACIEACPFDAMFWNPISGQVIKCQLCAGDPQCVRACPTGTLVLQMVADRTSKRKREEES